MPQINFVSARHKRFNKTRKQDLLILKVVAGVVAGIFLAAMTSVGTSIWFRGRLSRLQADVAQAKEAILLNEDAERSYVLLINKLKTLTTVLELRQDKQDALDFFTQVFGPNVLVKQIEYDDQARILSLRLQSPDVFVLENIFDVLDSEEVRSEYPMVNKGDLRRVDSGEYEMSLAIELNNEPEMITEEEGGLEVPVDVDPLDQEVPL